MLPWDRRWLHCECEEKRKERDCFQIAQAPKNRQFFHFLPGLREKKNSKEEAKSAEEGDGEIAGHRAKKWNCLVWEPAWRAGLKLEKFLKENSQPIKKKKQKKKRKKKNKYKMTKKRLNAKVGDEVYFVIRKGESSLRYTQRLSSSDIKLQFLFTIFYVLVLNFSFLDIFEKQSVFSFLNLHGLNLKGARNFLQS